MDFLLDLFLGDPVVDERRRIVKRNFGIKNAIAICFVLYALKIVLSKATFVTSKGTKRKKMKGGNYGMLFVYVIVAMFFIGVSCAGDESAMCAIMIIIFIVITMVGIVVTINQRMENKGGPTSKLNATAHAGNVQLGNLRVGSG